MARAICTTCMQVIPWSASRGSKLSSIVCPHCNTRTLRAARFSVASASGYVLARRDSDAKGQRFGLCVECGKRRLKKRLRILPVRVRMPWSRKTHAAGTTICRWHEFTRECGIHGCLDCFGEAV